MLTSIHVEINNNQYRGGIEIKSVAETNTLGNLSEVRIYRKLNETGNTNYVQIYTKALSAVSDLTFNLFDITTVSNKKYIYSIDLMAGNSIVESKTFSSVTCWFDGMFVGNFEKQYIAGTNYKVDSKRNTEVSYVTTIGSRVPYRVANANINFSSGSASGLFLELTDNRKKFVPDNDYAFSTEVIDFLTDGSNKILKTGDGQIWYVSIDDGVSKPFNDRYSGMNAINFSWTEIGDVPVFGLGVD